MSDLWRFILQNDTFYVMCYVMHDFLQPAEHPLRLENCTFETPHQKRLLSISRIKLLKWLCVYIQK